MVTPKVAICPHLTLEHYRGGEKWAASFANRLVEDGISVAVHALPYAPNGIRRVDSDEILDQRVEYSEAWRHDVSAYDAAYIFYNPLSQLFFSGRARLVAGIHSWVYVTDRLIESHYGALPTVVKALYKGIGGIDLKRFDAVHSVTPAYDSPHPETVHIPNFVDTELFHPDRAQLAKDFTVLVTAAHIPEKGWDTVCDLASVIPDDITIQATGTSEHDRIEDLGFLDEVALAEAYARAHVVVHPARVDTDSMVINEACASGTPVITTPIATHTRQNNAILHCDGPVAMLSVIQQIRDEWRDEDGYRERTRSARMEGLEHDFKRIYPQLRDLLLFRGGT